MVIKYKKPSEILQPFVDHYWEKENPNDHTVRYEMETILPETYLNLTFSLGTPYFRMQEGEKSFASMTAPQVSAMHAKRNFYRHRAGNHIFGVKFQPGGAYPFMSCDFSEITDQSLDMDLIFGDNVQLVAEKMYHLPDFESRVSCLEQFLLENFVENRLKKYNFVKKATNLMILPNNDGDCISNITTTLNSNYKTLSRYFNEVIGVSPKQFAQLLRFEKALQLLTSQKETNCTDIGYKSGYYDQAHFIHEFKKYANQTPNEFRALIGTASPNKLRNDFLQYLSPEHLLFYDVEM